MIFINSTITNLKTFFKKIKKSFYTTFNMCDHSWYDDNSFESVFHYGDIGQVEAIDSQKHCKICETVVRERMFTGQFSSTQKVTIKKPNKKLIIEAQNT